MKALSSEARFSRGVEALKGLAILGILFYHYYRRLSGVENQFQWTFGPLPDHPQEWGYLGTSLFFILSGWALTQSKLTKEETASDGEIREPLLQFYGGRFRRILPLYYLSLIIFFFGFLIFTRQEIPRLLGQFLLKAAFLQNISPETIFSYNSPWWFLGSLIFLYAAYPWLLGFFRKTPGLALGTCLAASFIFSHALAMEPIVTWHPYLAMGGFPFVKLGEFGLGIWLALVGLKFPGRWFAVTGLLAIFGFLGLWHRVFYPLHPIGLVAPFLLVGAWIPSLGLARLGAYSYGLFLFHRPLIDPWLHWLKARGLPDSAWLGPLVFTILVLTITIPLEQVSDRVFRRKSSF